MRPLRVVASSFLCAALLVSPAGAQVRQVRPEPPRPTPLLRLGLGLGLARGFCPEGHDGCARLSPLGFGGRGFVLLPLFDGLGIGIGHDRGRFGVHRGPASVHHFTGVFAELSTGYSNDSLFALWLAGGYVDTNGRLPCTSERAAGRGVQLGTRIGTHVNRSWSVGGAASVSAHARPKPSCTWWLDDHANPDVPVVAMALFALEVVYDVAPLKRPQREH